MLEHEHDERFLAELLEQPDPAGAAAISEEPILTRRDEQKLLDEANHVPPPTLAPAEIHLEHPYLSGWQRPESAESFRAEAVAIVRRHPIPALLFAAGLAYLLVRRHQRIQPMQKRL